MRATLLVFFTLSACSSSPDDLAGVDLAHDTADGGAPLDDATRNAAVTTTATTNPLCTAIAPFYWEIGDKDGLRGAGSIGTDAPTATTVMAIASASKWLFGAYVVEKSGGAPPVEQVPYLNFTSGYVNLDKCADNMGTVDDCLAGAAGTQTPADVGLFYYNGGHLEELASTMGLGAMHDAELADEVRSQLGTEIDLHYSEPLTAGGGYTSADQYALFLRKLLVGSATPLAIGALLDADAVCTNPATCPTSVSSPFPGHVSMESWHYGLGHWIEDDPTVGDHAYSSAGAFGFYPWVDHTRTYYGVLARKDAGPGQAGADSAMCGRLLRQAWLAGVAQ